MVSTLAFVFKTIFFAVKKAIFPQSRNFSTVKDPKGSLIMVPKGSLIKDPKASLIKDPKDHTY